MRTLLITLSVMIGFAVQASHPRFNSQLNISMAGLSNYTVTFNNTTYFATEWVQINNIPAGKHYLRIEENLNTYGRGMRASGRRVIYSGYVSVPGASVVDTRVNFNRRFNVVNIFRNHGRPVCNNGPAYDYGQQGPNDGPGYGGPGYGNPGNSGRPQGGYGQGRPGNNQNNDDDGYGDDGGYDDQDYDDGTYGTSQLQAKPSGNTRQQVNVKKVQPKSNK